MSARLLLVTLIAAWATGGTPSALAAKFANQFTQFELPAQWQCTLEGTEWVCNHTLKSKEREALVVLTAKLRGDQDTVDKYLLYLKLAKTYQSPTGKTITSKVKDASKISMDGIDWVDSTHMESEVPNYLTRYLATVKEDIAVLITYSVQSDKVALYQKDFDAMVKSLKIFRKKQLAENPAAGAKADLSKVAAQIPTSVGDNTVFGQAPKQEQAAAPKSRSSGGGDGGLTMILLAAAAGVGGFIFYKKKKAGG